ncbi:hypothetical protein K2173_015088 [Erythroxylum novogranatense]|uniref:Phorbol-ester/DAG-type domain-containing protein n=1 Tax=Erythroxylum novogranatense TaxID=1862640 RepID=A0AAV8T0X9_9ROSI|nr:hypothetical protein K2173_015088 [Erythroxylum novogranatense]
MAAVISYSVQPTYAKLVKISGFTNPAIHCHPGGVSSVKDAGMSLRASASNANRASFNSMSNALFQRTKPYVDEEYSNSSALQQMSKKNKGMQDYCDAKFLTPGEHLGPRCMKQIETEDFNDEHTMLSHAVHGLQQTYCYRCKEIISGLAYACQLCNIIFHKLCAEFPREIQHPLHSHPLLLFHVTFSGEYYVCNQCLNISGDKAYYRCEDCHFILDLNCASSGRDDLYPIPDQGDVSISHHSHYHKLRPANCPIEDFITCHICLMFISGPLFCCLQCAFFIHKSCREAPKEIEHQFHPEHSLRWSFLGLKVPKCKACNLSDNSLFQEIYTCKDCEFHIHYTCANYLTSSIKLKNHAHKFYYFLATDLRYQAYRRNLNFKCKVCGQNCNGSFYRCLECDMNLHLRCIPIPNKVRSQCHCHPLTLEYSVINECYEEEYCHECEDLRNADHAVYYCENCKYTAHIGCALDQVRFLTILLFFTLLSYSSPQLDMHSFFLNCSRKHIR